MLSRLIPAAIAMVGNAMRPLRVPLLILGASLGHGQLAAAEDLPSAQSVRAAMVFNFLKFTEFPGASLAPSQVIRICIAARDVRQAEALVALAGRKVSGRELVVSDLTAWTGTCHVLYVDTRQRWNALTSHPALRSALTISAYPGFVRDGGIFEIVLQPDATRFDVNLAEARRLDFHFSPEMLRLGRQIHE